MENFVSNALVQAMPVPDGSWSWVCLYLNWLFWIGFVVGVVGAIVSLFLKSPEGK